MEETVKYKNFREYVNAFRKEHEEEIKELLMRYEEAGIPAPGNHWEVCLSMDEWLEKLKEGAPKGE